MLLLLVVLMVVVATVVVAGRAGGGEMLEGGGTWEEDQPWVCLGAIAKVTEACLGEAGEEGSTSGCVAVGLRAGRGAGDG